MAPERQLIRALRGAGIRDVRGGRTARAVYSSDASLYRVVPQAVVLPREAEEVHAALSVARSLDVSITPRGAGTSVAGNAIGPGIVLDFSRYMNRLLDLDPVRRTASVEPGLVLADLQRAAAAHGLRFGPDPSTQNRATLGGMIGNDACGSRSLAYGRTSHNVLGLDLTTGSGELLETRRTTSGPHARGFAGGREKLRTLVGDHLSEIRTELGTFGRQISGYALHHLLPEEHFDLTGLLVGSEGTLGVTTRAEIRLVSEPSHRVLVVLGYDNFASAGDATPDVLTHRPTACEGLDRRIVEVVRERHGDQSFPPLPRGDAWLLVEISGDDPAEVLERAKQLVSTSAALDSRVVRSSAQATSLWKIRADGAGLAGRAPSGKPAWAGWEDAAVPPANLGSYLREFESLLDEFGLTAMPFGHFGEGCVHMRLDFDLITKPGRSRFREFLESSAEVVARHGGSLSGEHGDGRARSELLTHLYSPRLLALFGEVKQLFDPDDVLNPGVLVNPAPLDADLRYPSLVGAPLPLAMSYPADDGDFARAVHRCTGVGKCRSVEQGPGVVMCPSYAATKDEKDSTRGRARMLQELMQGELVGGWRSPALHEALDLCLSCKGCASDCPTGVDIATYKAEVLHQTYRGRRRPRSHYTLGWLPRWARWGSRFHRLVNSALKVRPIRAMALTTAGVDRRRSVPPFARQSLREWFALRNRERPSTGVPVIVFVDSFTNYFTPEVGIATIQLLESAGYQPSLSAESTCCALTWISTGQLDAARRRLTETVESLLVHAQAGLKIIGVEPSCTAVLRHDAVELLDSDAARQVADSTVTLSELLLDADWRPPSLAHIEVIAQPHCHHHAVMGWDADSRLLQRIGRSRHATWWVLRPGRQLRHGSRPLRDLGRGRRAAAPPSTRYCHGIHRGPGRRFLMPDPGPRPHRPAGRAPR